jgi:hypothetical protein
VPKNKVGATDSTIAQELPEISPNLYNEVARCAELLSVQLVESHFSILPSFFEEPEGGNLKLDFHDLDGKYDAEQGLVTAMFIFETSKKIKRRKVFSLKDTFVVFYGIDENCDDTHAVAFARKVGLMAAYPYFRAHTAHVSSLANANMPVLPTISTMPVRGKVKKETNDD